VKGRKKILTQYVYMYMEHYVIRAVSPHPDQTRHLERKGKKKMNGELLYIVKGTCYSLASNLTRKLQLVVI
jgi:hypothetical protein